MKIIYDLSSLIHSGAKASYSKSYQWKGFPTGGMFLVFKTLISDLSKGHEVIICCDSPTNTLYRYKYYDGYKSNRVTTTDTIRTPEQILFSVQFSVIEDILSSIGIPLCKYDGFEADDFIYSVVSKYNKEPIQIRTVDYDLVDTKMLNPQVSFITHKNIGLNEMPVGEIRCKIIEGCTSDKVPKLKYSTHHILKDLDFIKAKGTTEPDIEYIKSVTKLTGEPLQELARNIFLVVPHIINLHCIPNFKPITINDIDKDLFIKILTAFGLKSSLKLFGINELNETDEVLEIFDTYNLYKESVLYEAFDY